MFATALHLNAITSPGFGEDDARRRGMSMIALDGAADALAAPDNALAGRCMR